MKENEKNLNNFCMNCGKKVNENDEACKECNTAIIKKRIRTDNYYIVFILLSLAGIISGNVYFGLLGYISICIAQRLYKKNTLVTVFFWIETVPILYFLLLLIYLLIVCG